MSIARLMQMAAAGQAGDYEISRSLRFNSADSAYLSRTPATASNRKTWTWSGWVKRTTLSSTGTLFAAGTSSGANLYVLQTVGNQLAIRMDQEVSANITTTQVFRDVSAWYHFVIAVDTTQATGSNRVKIYVNGSQITAFDTSTYPSQDFLTAINNNVAHEIGVRGYGSDLYLNSYLTEINFIDGQALTPTSFGETNATTGVWSPIRYAGSYGTNGFYLNFSDNTSTTTLGEDQAGSNDWTLNNFSVTAGAGNDSLVDTPTPYGDDTGAGGEVRGNYCTANPLDMNPTLVISNGNLNVTETTGAWLNGRCTFGMSSGKWYAESTITGGLYQVFGIANSLAKNTGYEGSGLVGNWAYSSDGSKVVNGVYNPVYGATYTTNDVIGMAFDADAGTLTMYKNGVSQGVLVSGLPANTYFPWVAVNGSGGNTTVSFNFGQRPFAYTAPSGFKALVTTNLPEPTVLQGDDHFNTVLYTGNGAASGDTQVISTVGFQPDFVWFKSRTNTYSHVLIDSVRSGNKILYSDSTQGELTSTLGGITAFSSSGFTVAADTSIANSLNTSGSSNVAWNWKANGAGVSNTDGSITSTVSANTTAGISIVSFTADSGTSIFTVGHGLSITPAMVIVKSRTNGVAPWYVYHSSLATDNYLRLNGTNATASATDQWGAGMTSTLIGLRAGYSTVASTDTIAYCFAEVEGFSKFGSYTGNGSTDGPFVYTGFRPAFVLVKLASGGSGSSNWSIFDTSRNTFNLSTQILAANASDAEFTAADTQIDILSNGIKIRSTSFSFGINQSGVSYIFAAFAENPFKNSLAR